MARSIIAVIVGYVAMFIFVFTTFTGAFLLMGTDWSFKPNSFEASNAWNIMALVASLVIAVIAGFICAAIARGGKAPIALAIVVFALGILFAIPTLFANKQNANRIRTGNISQMEAMQNATQPAWVPFTFPILGAIGVLVGAKLKRKPDR
jgi:uncharacterized membrane protein